jgi:PKHD-type hydroxylase
MLLHIPKVLDAGQVADFRRRLAAAGWTDGRITAGYQSARAKSNLQLPESDPVARELSAVVRAALDRSPLFFAAALPRRVFTPLFNRYEAGNGFGNHVDNAVRYEQVPGLAGQPVRTDLSATLFLSVPEEYDGGELVIGAASGSPRVKLPAGDMVLYSATTVHKVEAITRGERLASFFWIQSMVRDDGKRSLLFDLDVAIQKLNQDQAGHPSAVELVGVYHNLLRRWAEL